MDVRVDGERGDAEGLRHDHGGRLVAHAGQTLERLLDKHLLKNAKKDALGSVRAEIVSDPEIQKLFKETYAKQLRKEWKGIANGQGPMKVEDIVTQRLEDMEWLFNTTKSLEDQCTFEENCIQRLIETRAVRVVRASSIFDDYVIACHFPRDPSRPREQPLNRSPAAPQQWQLSPAARRSFTATMSTNASFTTTPESATIPSRLTMLRSYPMSRCPANAPTTPNGIATITMIGWM